MHASPRDKAEQMASGSISLVLSLDGHLSRTYVTARLKHATRMHERANRMAFLFALARDGVYQAVPLPARWCALAAPFQLFSRAKAAWESSFLWHFPSGHPAQPLAGILPLRARTFLTPRHARRAAVWPARGKHCTKVSRD